MAKTVRIGSKVHTPLRITEAPANPDKPGDGPALRSIVLNPAPYVEGEGYTELEPEDAKIYRAWFKANPAHPAIVAGHLREVDADEDANADQSFGYEPGLEEASKDKDITREAKKGSRVKDKAPVSAEDMAATSDTPNTDRPTSQTGF